MSAQPVNPQDSLATGPAVSSAPERNVVSEAPLGEVVLKITDLSVRFPSDEGPVNAVQDLTYEARLGRTLAIGGESGSGKAVSTMAGLGRRNPKRSKNSGSIQRDQPMPSGHAFDAEPVFDSMARRQ